MSTSTWDIAIVELVYYSPSFFPVAYCFWRHRHYGLGGWFFLCAFMMLQIIGSGMIASAGQHGIPSSTAIIITNVGLSPLLLGIAGLVHEWARIASIARDKSAKRWVLVLVVVYHVAVVAAIALYASGASQALSGGVGNDDGRTEWRVGVVLLLILWILLCVVFVLLACKIGMARSKVWFLPLLASLTLLGIRIIYTTVATFHNDQGKYSLITGSTALKVIFDFLPGALIVLVVVVGGVMSLEQVKAAHDSQRENIGANDEQIEVGNPAGRPKFTN